MKRYPPTKKILQFAPQYHEDIRSYFDLNDEILLPICNTTRIIFFSILNVSNYISYKVTYNKKDLTNLYGVRKTYVLGVHTKIHKPSFHLFLESFFDTVKNEKNIEEIEIDIESNDENTSITFLHDFILQTYVFRSLSESFTECFLYEYFKIVSQLNHKYMFSFSDSEGFYIRGSNISLKQFIEEYFGNTFGVFESKEDLAVTIIFDHNYNWKGTVSEYADQLDTNKNEFLLPLNTISIPFVLRQKVENKLLLSFKEK